MGERLAERLARIGIQHPREHFLRDRKRVCLAGDDGRHVVEPRQMMFAQLRKPCVQRAKRQAVRRQHQRVRRQRLEPRQRIQIFLHRVGIRLRRRHDHRWRHVRQDLIARDQDVVLLAMEQRMFGRMAACRDHPPLPLPHGDDVAVPDADEFARRPQAEIFRLALGFDDVRGVIVGCAISLHEDGKLLVRSLLALMPHLPAVEPFGQRQPHRAFRFLHQIAGKAEVIEMRMGEGEVLQGTGAQQPAPKLVPDLENVVGVHAAIDQRPSRAVVEQPAIDVIGQSSASAAAPRTVRAGRPSIRHRPADAGR